jgi:hypothetical protein
MQLSTLNWSEIIDFDNPKLWRKRKGDDFFTIVGQYKKAGSKDTLEIDYEYPKNLYHCSRKWNKTEFY